MKATSHSFHPAVDVARPPADRERQPEALVAQLRASEARLWALAAATTSAIWKIDTSGELLDAPTDRWPYLTDLPPEELEAEWLAAVHPDDREPGNTIWWDAVARGVPFEFEQRVRQRNGSYRHFAVRAVPVRDDQGVIREWIGADVDITDRKAASEALRESEERLRLGLEVAGFALAEIDYAADTIHLSAEAARLYGIGAEAVRIPRAQIHATFHPDDRDDLLDRIERAPALVTDQPYTTEYRVMWPSGDVRWLSVRKRIFVDRSGPSPRLTRAVLAILDITERKRAEEERVTFFDALAHDMKNPLGAAKGQVQLINRRLERGSDDPERIQRGLATIEEAIDGTVALLNELLDAARLRVGQPLDLWLDRCDLVQLAAEAIARVQRRATNVTIRLESALPGVVGEWDEIRLGRVAHNLLENAVKYSPDGGEVLVQVGLVRDDTGEWATLAVRDRGIGIPAADLPYLFDRFRRGGNVATIRGTGIGLTGARQIVEQHGGAIVVESKEGVGSTFTVHLPLTTPGE